MLVALVATMFAPGLIDAPPVAAGVCGPAPAGRTAVVVVIDRGSGTPSQHCVVVPDRSTGLDALMAIGTPVRLEAGGFVCAIGGLPSSGCAMTQNAGADYWRYWHGSGSDWVYSSVGAGTYRLPGRCAVEGWSYGPPASAGQPVQPPRIRPPAVDCSQPTTSTAPAPTPAPPRPAPTVAPSGPGPTSGAASTTAPVGGASGSPGAGRLPGVVAEGPDGSVPRPDRTARNSDVAPAANPDGDGGTRNPGGHETDPADGDAGGGEAEVRSEQSSAPGVADGSRVDSDGVVEVASSDEAASTGGGGSWAGVVLVLLAASAVGGGALRRARARART
jgi:hypothetical protein